MENINNEQPEEINILVLEYKEKEAAIKHLEDDITQTEEALEDPYLDYATRCKYGKDIAADKLAIMGIMQSKDELLEFIKKNNLMHLVGYANDEDVKGKRLSR